MNVVLSPHTDDAVFSIGAYLAAQPDVTIVTPLAGIPADPAGRDKHTTLRAEHDKACHHIGAAVINGDFLDDVYPAPRRNEVAAWLAEFIGGDALYVPFGIHHPDHLLITNLTISLLNTSDTLPDRVFFYEELPYRVDYPELANIRFAYLENAVGRLRMVEDHHDDTLKRLAVNEYRSQTSGDVIDRVMVRERIWELTR